MSNKKMLMSEMINAILSYDSKKLNLNGLIYRLEELSEALADEGVKWQIDIDEYLLQMEIINSLVASGDNSCISAKDISEIGTYLRSIENEISKFQFSDPD